MNLFSHFYVFTKRVEKEKNFFLILRIRSDKGGEFINHSFITYCEKNRIKYELSCPRTLQQNGVIDRKNHTLQEIVRTMISECMLSQYLWVEAVSTSCYILNRVYFCKNTSKTPFEIYYLRKSNVSYI